MLISALLHILLFEYILPVRGRPENHPTRVDGFRNVHIIRLLGVAELFCYF